MNDDNLKKAFNANFKKEAPVDFTQNLMSKIEASDSSYESLIPKSVFAVLLIGFLILCGLTIIFQPSVKLPFSTQFLTSFVNDFFSLLIIPLVVITLLFIKNMVYYFKVSKTS